MEVKVGIWQEIQSLILRNFPKQSLVNGMVQARIQF